MGDIYYEWITGKKEERMTDAEKIKRIEELLNDLDLADMSRNELWRELKGQSFDEIEEEMWHWYCFISDICNVVMR